MPFTIKEFECLDQSHLAVGKLDLNQVTPNHSHKHTYRDNQSDSALPKTICLE
jgi:hypothetical protein